MAEKDTGQPTDSMFATAPTALSLSAIEAISGMFSHSFPMQRSSHFCSAGDDVAAGRKTGRKTVNQDWKCQQQS